MFNHFLLATVSLLTASCIFANTARAESKEREQQLPRDRQEVWPTPLPTLKTPSNLGKDPKTRLDRMMGKSPLEWPSNEDYCLIGSYNPCLEQERQQHYNRSRSQESSGSQDVSK